jgi:hypothetical protein
LGNWEIGKLKIIYKSDYKQYPDRELYRRVLPGNRLFAVATTAVEHYPTKNRNIIVPSDFFPAFRAH